MSFLPPNLGFKCLFLPFTTEYISKSSLQHSYHISSTGTLTYCKYKRQVKWKGNISQSYSSRFILSKKTFYPTDIPFVNLHTHFTIP